METKTSKRTGTNREDNKVIFDTLDHPVVVNSFIENIKKGINAGYRDFILDFSKIHPIFPNASVPISGLIQYYKNTGVVFSYIDNSDNIISSTQFFDPIEPQDGSQLKLKNTLNKIWKFSNHESVFWLVNSFLEELRRSDIFEEGVLVGIEWCVNEIMDNVLNHSSQSIGFIMGQIHKSKKHIAFTVFDYGQGIYNSLKDSTYAPRHPLDAITLSVKEGVSRDKKNFQGNGIFGLHQIVKFNEGRLSITSNSAAYILKKDIAKSFKNVPTISREVGCTTIDFQLDYGNKISISDALKFGEKNYEIQNILLESLENEYNQIHYKINERVTGSGTRPSGLRTRNDILNIIKETKKVIVLDFDEIVLITSSFADEVIGKLLIELGFYGFNNIIRLRNMNSTVQNIVQRSVSQRMAQSLNK
ncbi:STAS-like domain-containing protein [Emticicia sp. BO119]|uniref:STAS-like domain-containing protein n=1 Tax=Emticicia sp. BO119 TaxID=2757768 RepID=UPI0015F070AF|nr:STAS-like domain-containing protein [Emticicia sp. BO119]MBA4852004.1 STAS-like domain-containing protein [Emticicia sp. BO119]